MYRKILFAGMLCLAVVLAGCGAVESIIGGGKSAGTVSTLWSDVPPFEGASKTDIGLPAGSTLLINGFLKAANSGNDSTVDQLDFIAYNTPKTPEDVANFYTVDMMKNAGWNDADSPGCAGGNGVQTTGGGFCAFGKKDGNKGTELFIIMAQDDSTKLTQIFYIRAAVTNKTGS